jgi:Transcriptional regulators
MNTTMDDVAQAAGCSQATVSRVMRGSQDVSEDVRQRVEDALRRTAYKPRRQRRTAAENSDGNGAAAGLRLVSVVFHMSGPHDVLRTTTRGVDVAERHVFQASELQDPRFHSSLNFEQGMLEGLLEVCAHFKAKAHILPADDLMDPRLLAEVRGADGGGVIVAGMYSADLDEFLTNCRPPVVLLDLLCKGGPDAVTSDNIDGMRQSVRHLAGLGHREIGFIGGKNPAYEERFFGFVGEMAAAGLAVRPEFVVESLWRRRAGWRRRRAGWRLCWRGGGGRRRWRRARIITRRGRWRRRASGG